MRVAMMTLAAALCAAAAASEPLTVYVPISWCNEPRESQVAELRKMHDQYGLRRFVLIGPWMLQYRRNTTIEDWEELGRSIAWAKTQLADLDVDIGWWCDPTLSGGRYRPFQCLQDCDCNKTYATCPLDPGFRKDFADKVAACARIAKPSIIFFEDDYTLSNHGGMNAMKGCFCPLHLAEYA